MKIVQYLEELGLVLNVVCETIEKEAKEKKGAFMGILLGVLGASLLGNMLVGKGVIKRGMELFEQVKKQIDQAGFLMLPLPLTNFEIQKYYQNEPGFNGVYSRNNLPETNDGACVINLD